MSSASEEGKPLKVKAQGRYRHETRPERSWTEQSVKRLREPEDAAQPGEANQVLVAVRFCKRRRARDPKVGRSIEAGLESIGRRAGHDEPGRSSQTLNVRRRTGEDGDDE